VTLLHANGSGAGIAALPLTSPFDAVGEPSGYSAVGRGGCRPGLDEGYALARKKPQPPRRGGNRFDDPTRHSPHGSVQA
jgi:hypothetical protein